MSELLSQDEIDSLVAQLFAEMENADDVPEEKTAEKKPEKKEKKKKNK